MEALKAFSLAFSRLSCLLEKTVGTKKPGGHPVLLI